MQDVNVVVVFCSRDRSGERLALAAALGAVQAKANIRLRRLPAASAEPGIESPVMDGEYIAPRESDAAWADAFLLVRPAGNEVLWPEVSGFFELLESMGAQEKLRAGMEWIAEADSAGLEQAGLQGHRIVAEVRAVKRPER